MTRETNVPSIPAVTSDNIEEVLRAIKGVLEVREGKLGDPLDQVVTMRDLTALKLASNAGETATDYGASLPVQSTTNPFPQGWDDGYVPENDFSTPPAPTNLIAAGGGTNVYLSWDAAPYRNHAYTEVWRSSVDSLTAAVLIGTTIGSLYSDPVDFNRTYWYWIRFVSKAEIIGPYNKTSGTVAKTSIDVSEEIRRLQGEVLDSEFFGSLNERISRIQIDQYASEEAIESLGDAKDQLRIAMSQNGSAVIDVRNVTESQATLITLLGTRTSQSESNISTLQTTTATQATSLTNLTTRVGTSESNISTLQTTTSTQATSISNLSTTVDGHTTSISGLTTTTNGLSAQYSLKIDNNGFLSGFGLSSDVVDGTPFSSLIVNADRFSIVNPSGTLYTITSLSRSGTTATLAYSGATNVFAANNYITIRNAADGKWNGSFKVVSASTSSLTFTISTSPATPALAVSGKTLQVGQAVVPFIVDAGTVYINTAAIKDATITSAQISSLVADKITAGTITAAIDLQAPKVRSGAITYAQISAGTPGFFLGDDGGTYKVAIGNGTDFIRWNGTNLEVRGNLTANSGTFRSVTIYDANNNVILSSGGVPSSAVTGLGSLATASQVAWDTQISGKPLFGSLATQSSVTTAQVTGLGTLATLSSVNWNSQITNIPSFGNFAYLSSITSANISTYIAAAAIGNAYISDLNATKLTAGLIDSARLDAAVINAKVANVGTAQISDGAITNAKIGSLQVDTLKIAGNAVTVSSIGGGAGFTTVFTTTPLGRTDQVIARCFFTLSGLGTASAGVIAVAHVTVLDGGGASTSILGKLVLYETSVPGNRYEQSRAAITLGDSKTMSFACLITQGNGNYALDLTVATADPGAVDKYCTFSTPTVVVMAGKR